jgi:hypothetical protein
MRRFPQPAKLNDALGGVFDTFLDEEAARRDVDSESAWQGHRIGRDVELAYDPKLPSSVIAYIERTVGAEKLAELGVRLTCAQCGVPYYEKDNIGKFQCAYHTLSAVPQLYGKHPCCERPTGSPGCRTADHRAQLRERNMLWTAKDCTVRIPSILASRYKIDINDPDVVRGIATSEKDPARSYLIVSRVGGRAGSY